MIQDRRLADDEADYEYGADENEDAADDGGADDYAYNAADDYTYAVNDDAADDGNDDKYYDPANEKCSQYLVSFLEGTTDAKDNCEGIMNAYVAAGCVYSATSENDYQDDDDNDDYFGTFYERMCCQSLLTHHMNYCDEGKLVSNLHF